MNFGFWWAADFILLGTSSSPTSADFQALTTAINALNVSLAAINGVVVSFQAFIDSNLWWPMGALGFLFFAMGFRGTKG